MLKLRLVLLLLLPSFFIKAQTTTYTPEEKATLDSMFAADEFFQMLMAKDSSYMEAGIGIRNGVFSTHNFAENATGVTNIMVLTPAIAYHHKSGLGISATFFLSSGAGKLELYQTGIGISYDKYGDKWSKGISYTRFLSDRDKYNSNSLYQNDLYGYFKKAKGLIRPGIATGYSSGKYYQVDAILKKRPLLGDTLVYDTTHNKGSYFSISASIDHEFKLYKLISKNDELDITPSLIINAGTDKISTTHLNKVFDRRILNRFKKTELSSGLQFQSIALLIDLVYGIGKFYFEPYLYIDHYLPSTTTKRWSSYFSVSAGFYF